MYRTVEVDVEVDVGDFDTDELLRELRARNLDDADMFDIKHIVQTLYDNKRANKNEEFERTLSTLFDTILGRIV